jgi:Flp pilus assembly protein TadG
MRYSQRKSRRGVTMLYTLVALVMLAGFVSLGSDYARVQLVKTELQRAADAAARYGAMALPNGATAVRANAIAAAGDNLADGSTVVLQNTDIEFGTWNGSTKVFTVTSPSSATAVRVTAMRSMSRGNAVPLTFGSLLGQSACEAKCASISSYSPAVDVVSSVPSTSNPWLAGMPSGTVANPGNPHNNPDYAPSASPQQVNGVPLIAGQALTFDSINGGANNFNSTTLYTPDGNTGWIVNNFGGAEHGKSNLTAPINAVIGVFLDDQQPNLAGAVPSSLDFSTAASRDFSSLSPQLRQPFFVGDGRKNDGTVQQFVVPPGATRLFIGTMDGYEWNNNVGGYTTTIHRIPTVTTVK